MNNTLGYIKNDTVIHRLSGTTKLITMNQPEVYIAAVHTLFDEDGNLVKDTKTFLEDSTRAFVDFAKKHS